MYFTVTASLGSDQPCFKGSGATCGCPIRVQASRDLLNSSRSIYIFMRTWDGVRGICQAAK